MPDVNVGMTHRPWFTVNVMGSALTNLVNKFVVETTEELNHNLVKMFRLNSYSTQRLVNATVVNPSIQRIPSIIGIVVTKTVSAYNPATPPK